VVPEAERDPFDAERFRAHVLNDRGGAREDAAARKPDH
jgi:hypothetical protein